MPCCAVPTCKNAAGSKNKKDGITFHIFPADETRKAIWVKIIRKARLEEFWKPSKGSVICSAHFDEKYFYDTKCGLKRLMREAFPSKNLAIATEDSGPGSSCFWNNDSETRAQQAQSPTRSNSEIGDVNISDMDYIFDSPKEAKIRSQLHQTLAVCEKYARVIKTLKQKNRRLAKKNALLKIILKKIKEFL